MQDPTYSGTVWHVLAHAPDAWNLRLVTSEVAIAAAVAGYGRRVDVELAKLDKLSNSWGALGLIDVAGLAKASLVQKVPGIGRPGIVTVRSGRRGVGSSDSSPYGSRVAVGGRAATMR